MSADLTHATSSEGIQIWEEEKRIKAMGNQAKNAGIPGDESGNVTLNAVPEESIAFQAGRDARRMGIPLRQSALRALRPGCKQYDDFIDGYESAKRKRR